MPHRVKNYLRDKGTPGEWLRAGKQQHDADTDPLTPFQTYSFEPSAD